MTALTLNLNPIMTLSYEQFYKLCQENENLRFERNINGELIIMSPTGGETSKSNANLVIQLGLWNEQTQLGEVFDSNGGFILPNGAVRSPDVSWVEKSRYSALTSAEKEKFLPLCPDFVIELLSPTDNLKNTQVKMLEYLDNGCLLGWLINRKNQQVEIYRPTQTVEILESPATISGENVLPGFILNFQKIWGK